MKLQMLFAIALTGSTIVGCASEQYTHTTRDRGARIDTLHALKIADIVSLSKSGVSDSLIIAMMDATDSWYRLTPQEVIDLKNAGVSERVIAAMLQTPPEPPKPPQKSVVRYYYVDPWWGYYSYWPTPRFRAGIGLHPHGAFPPRHGRFR